MRQLSKHQWALLGVLLLHPRSITELLQRWPYALRTIRSCKVAGVVETYRGEEIRAAGEAGDWVRITDAGLRYFGTPEQTQGLGTWERRP